MDVMKRIIANAKANPQRIVLPEGTELRTLKAADRVIADQMAHIILLGNKAEILSLAEANDLKSIAQATIIDPANNPDGERYAAMLCELRKKKGMTIEKARTMVQDPLYLACLMIKDGAADGEVAGAQNATGNVLRPALQIIKTAPGISCVSGAFLMINKDTSYGDEGVMLFADCAVMPNPTAAELAQIAVSSSQTIRALVGLEPRVAMLSFSSMGSASHETVDKVIEATRIAKEMAPELMIDGELQADAAMVPAVGLSKAPGSAVAGKANVLVFPTLDAGNIGYKLVQRLAGSEAYGPVLQGIGAPVNDLSRGCFVEDIYSTIAITANQAIALKKNI